MVKGAVSLDGDLTLDFFVCLLSFLLPLTLLVGSEVWLGGDFRRFELWMADGGDLTRNVMLDLLSGAAVALC